VYKCVNVDIYICDIVSAEKCICTGEEELEAFLWSGSWKCISTGSYLEQFSWKGHTVIM